MFSNILKNYPKSILLISLLFFIKALYLSFFVTPFPGVPDEIGHFAYVQDIAYGKGIPILSAPSTGKSIIGSDIMKYVEKTTNAQPAYNWIAQHPPIYYVVAAIPLKIGSFITDDPEILFRLPRIVSALSGALLLLVLFRIFKTIGLDTSRSTAIAAAISFIPMVSNLSSGTNHDILLFLFCALATFFFTRFIIYNKIRDSYQCAMWLTIAGATKMMTPWVLLIPVIFILILELPKSNRALHALGVSLTAVSMPLIWMVRNFIYFGNPLYTSGTDRKPGLDIPLSQNFPDFIHFHPTFDTVIHWFYGMFISFGPGQENFYLTYDVLPRHLRFVIATADNFPYTVFLTILFIVACICVIYIAMLILHISKNEILAHKKEFSPLFGNFYFFNHHKKFLFLIAGIFFAFIFTAFIGYTSITNLNFIFFLIIPISILLGIVACFLIFHPNNALDKIAIYGFIFTLFFGSVFLYHIYQAYLTEGQILATQGRYFYPIIPFALLSASIALMRLRVPGLLINIAVSLLACAELFVYVQQALPFYLKYS
ncbi:hypothetical protein CFter6_1094 [Collimonas fungivorans]|uniref:Glycosyltransferase RgtA/B/C/D-like domain-containing protein n=1 Tax=Collimonas fungivorans TaxID=158899 RepID=A0A127P7L2_9BURK|nr:DUF2142 domain-containing protein [Collimonas fungivorans]AMO93812.1 hypothetical protein CFter6_1094 [Collimonas fungivorans]